MYQPPTVPCTASPPVFIVPAKVRFGSTGYHAIEGGAEATVAVSMYPKVNRTVTLSPSPACGATGAVCTEDGRTFTTALATQIQGPPGLSVADAQVQEAA